VRALTEAAQSRLTFIAGSRDDVPDLEPRLDDAERQAQRRELALWDGPLQPFAAAPDTSFDDFGAETDWLLRRLRATGIPEVVAVDLGRPELHGIHVVRVVAPGLEADIDHPDHAPGPRAAKVLLAR
jgi:ribosomal protein S12 methylthiotransferase accessory factor